MKTMDQDSTATPVLDDYPGGWGKAEAGVGKAWMGLRRGVYTFPSSIPWKAVERKQEAVKNQFEIPLSVTTWQMYETQNTYKKLVEGVRNDLRTDVKWSESIAYNVFNFFRINVAWMGFFWLWFAGKSSWACVVKKVFGYLSEWQAQWAPKYLT